MKISFISLFILLNFFANIKAETAVIDSDYTKIETKSKDSLIKYNKTKTKTNTEDKLSYKPFIIPSLFIGYGIIVRLNLNEEATHLDFSTRREILEDDPGFATVVDNFTQYVPALAVFGLQACGVKGKHNWIEGAEIYAISMSIVGSVVIPTKYLTKVERPDGSTKTSFPSGHTATAFASAEFLRKEYWDVSPWIGVAGYSLAVSTGILRMFNNRHWFSDVVTGAGVGLASTNLAYWIHTKIHWPKKLNYLNIYPTYNVENKNIGIGINSIL